MESGSARGRPESAGRRGVDLPGRLPIPSRPGILMSIRDDVGLLPAGDLDGLGPGRPPRRPWSGPGAVSTRRRKLCRGRRGPGRRSDKRADRHAPVPVGDDTRQGETGAMTRKPRPGSSAWPGPPRRSHGGPAPHPDDAVERRPGSRCRRRPRPRRCRCRSPRGSSMRPAGRRRSPSAPVRCRQRCLEATLVTASSDHPVPRPGQARRGSGGRSPRTLQVHPDAESLAGALDQPVQSPPVPALGRSASSTTFLSPLRSLSAVSPARSTPSSARNSCSALARLDFLDGRPGRVPPPPGRSLIT